MRIRRGDARCQDLYSRRILFGLKDDSDLLKAIRAIETVYGEHFHEEGTADIYFDVDIESFPPPLPLSYRKRASKLELLITRGEFELLQSQRSALSRLGGYRENYYLLAKEKSDGDQITPCIRDVATVNKNFKVLSILSCSQDYEYDDYQQPMVFLYALRNRKAVVEFCLSDDFKPHKKGNKEAEIKSVLDKTVAAYQEALNTSDIAAKDVRHTLNC